MVRIVVLFSLLSWLIYRLWAYWPDDYVHLIFCDVGQGDAIIIRHKSFQMLIDGGKDSAVLTCLQHHIPIWDKTLEVMVATHPHSDHINGLVPVLDHFQVKTVLHNGQLNQSADFDRFKQAVQKEFHQGGTVLVAHFGQHVKLGNYIDVSILYPTNNPHSKDPLLFDQAETLLSAANDDSGQSSLNYNDNSVVLKVSYYQLEVLLVGDLEETGERALLEDNLIEDVEVLKVGHHGAKTSSTPGFLARVKPEISVISVGENNSYGHPHPLVLEELNKIGSLILRTDVDSSIELVSDGQHLWSK